eukprot:9958008-Karenia_brevis.AAC.1
MAVHVLQLEMKAFNMTAVAQLNSVTTGRAAIVNGMRPSVGGGLAAREDRRRWWTQLVSLDSDSGTDYKDFSWPQGHYLSSA